MEKYFNLQYWLTIISLCFVGLIIVVSLIKFIVDKHRQKSKKWKYNYVSKKYERVDE
jgi:hypothetical protein